MAKCAVCGKSQSNGNKLSITRSHISKKKSKNLETKFKKC